LIGLAWHLTLALSAINRLEVGMDDVITAEEPLAEAPLAETLLAEEGELLVEDVSIDGMCGVY
jgi:mycofactocin precursor